MIHNAQTASTFPPVMADRIRTTISLDPEVHAIFVKMADASGTSVSRCMGDWLADTAEGAQFVASKMQEARKAPKAVMRELQAMAHGLHEEISAGVSALRLARPRPGAASAAVEPPSSPTGVKSPKNPGNRTKGAA